MTSRLRIDLAAVAANYRKFCELGAPAAMAAVVKANAYGLGVEPVGRTLWAAGCRDYFVASAEEGARLRATLGAARILVFEGAMEETVGLLLEHDLEPVLNHPGQAAVWRRAGGRRPAAVHVDTGMHRLGFPVPLAADALRGLDVTLLVTHLACADEVDHPLTARQLDRVAELRRLLPGVPFSVGNSAGVAGTPSLAGDLGRPGIGLYGGNPFVSGANPFAPVVTFEAQVLQRREVDAGDAIGYGASFVAAGALTVAVVGAGYADGVPRLLSNRGFVTVAGARRPIVGRVSMDLTAVDVSGCMVAEGDWVELFGTGVTVDEVAAWAQTIPYEVLTGLGQRPRRSYLT
ncbi:MAG: alanine racemase [Pseudomonadales bacterium]